jgi:hypothetical protein
MGIFKGAMVAAALALAGPVWAHGGYGYDQRWDDGRWRGHHQRWDRDDHGREWQYYRRHHRHWDRAPRQHYYNPGYYAPSYAQPPAYGYVAPPGVHIIETDIYVPFR